MKASERLTSHPYNLQGNRETPIDATPPEFQREITFPGGRKQTVDIRLCYALERTEAGDHYVESAVTANDAQHFLNESPQSQQGV